MNQMQQMLMNAQRMQRELQKAHAALAEKEFKVFYASIAREAKPLLIVFL